MDGDKHRPDDVPSGSGEVVFEVPATPADREAIRVRFRGLACDAHLADSCRSFSFDVPVGETVTHRHSLGTFRDPERAIRTREVTADARAFW